MAKLVVISKGQAGLSHELGTHWVTIGRAPGSVFQILEGSISGNHCEVQLRGNELSVRDMRSTNGTYVRGALVSEGTVKIGESFRLGDVELRLEATVPVVSVSSPDRDKPLQTAAKTTKTASVLLVDDSMAFLETASDIFSTLGSDSWEIHTASAPDTALAILQQGRIDLIILDIVMPVLDGGQLLTMIHRRYPDVKKVVLTGHLTESNRAACLASGAELVLEKPTARDGFKALFNVLNDLVCWSQREGFSGTLRHVGLVDVIQLQCIARKSCILQVRNAQIRGEIYIEGGLIVHAATGTISGDKAFHKLLSLLNGEFHLQAFSQPPERTVQGSWEYLLMESARIRDEEKDAKATADTIHLANHPNPMSESLPPIEEELVVVSTYDGQWHPVNASQ